MFVYLDNFPNQWFSRFRIDDIAKVCDQLATEHLIFFTGLYQSMRFATFKIDSYSPSTVIRDYFEKPPSLSIRLETVMRNLIPKGLQRSANSIR